MSATSSSWIATATPDASSPPSYTEAASPTTPTSASMAAQQLQPLTSATNATTSTTTTPRRPKPTQVQTSFLPPSFSTPPTSAISTSSVTTASSLQVSPIMSPELALLTTNNSSVQQSPDGPRGCESDYPPSPFELPESIVPGPIVSRKSSQNAMHDAIPKSGPGLIRRLSNRASQFAGRRRQSSTTAMSREHSQGPITMRRRSDSTNTAPEGTSGRGPFSYDSDDDVSEDPREELGIAAALDGRYGPLNINTCITAPSPSSNPTRLGPVIPASLLEGTTMIKVNKRRNKLLTFVLESEAAKVTWDKSRPSKSFYIDNIKDIRFGPDAQNYRKELGIQSSDESRFFSIVYAIPEKSKGRSQKVMHLIASDERTFDLWTSTLDAISKHRQDLMSSLSSFHEKAVKTYWHAEMNKQFMDLPHNPDDEAMDIGDVVRLCRALHIFTSTEELQAKFSEANISRTGRLKFAEIQEFVKLMKNREDVVAIYQEIAAEPENGLTLEEFLAFLRDCQFEEVTDSRQHWEGIFAKFVRRSKSKEQSQKDALDGVAPRMTASALTGYLTSTFNTPFEGPPATYTMDRPLNEYFISSSHNTYLLSRQVAGHSNAEAYISALSRGCRCVEVDCWNGADGPVVMHGRTLTTQVSFALVMSTIDTYAFVKSQFPLIISLEVHCNPQQQAQMADIMRKTFGSKLVTEPLDPSSGELPSPSQLMNRILIKVKQPRVDSPMEVTGRSRGSSMSSPYIQPARGDNSLIPPSALPLSAYPRTARVPKTHVKQSSPEGQEYPSSGTSDSESLVGDIAKAQENSDTNKTSNIVKILGELGVYAAGFKFHGFDAPECRKPNHIFSFMEQTFDSKTKSPEEKRALARHNVGYLMRVYPNRWRVASTNFDPLKYWRRGVQMVALNWQTYDLGLQLNHAMFAAGMDQSGYVLKPAELRGFQQPLPDVPEEAEEGRVKHERKNINFSIQVKSAQQLIPPKNLLANRGLIGAYVEVEVYHADDKTKENKGVVGEGGLDASAKDGSSGLGAPHRRRTHIVRGNGFNPLFGEEFHFALTTKYPELVFVRWTVRCSTNGESYSDRGPPLATYTARLNSLKQGYRTLPLFDNEGDRFLFSTLFCHVKVPPATSIYVNRDADMSADNVSVLKSIGRTVWRSTPMSPRPSAESFS